MIKDLSERSVAPELMDDFQEGPAKLRDVYNDINRVNRLLGGNAITIEGVVKLMKKNPRSSYTIIDMGCGDGELLRKIADYCRAMKQAVRLIGIDVNAEVLQLAIQCSQGYREISFAQQDILEIAPDDFMADIVINTLCMHHFNQAQLPIFLTKFVVLAQIGVVINDLHRSVWAYYLFKCFSLIFIRTNTAKIDGLISISKGFTKNELLYFAQNFPDLNHEITWKWAFRYQWIMNKHQTPR